MSLEKEQQFTLHLVILAELMSGVTCTSQSHVPGSGLFTQQDADSISRHGMCVMPVYY